MNYLFEMPDQVIDELSNDWYREQDPTYYSQNKDVTCKRCSCRNLKWVRTNDKWTLAYSAGKLKGKLHACAFY